MANLTIKAKKRSEVGRKVKRLRKAGLLPGNVYGKNVKSESISIDMLGFGKLFTQAGETSIVELDVDGKKKPTLIHNIQKDPVTDEMIHVDFLQVDLKQKVTAQIPVELVGESPAEKQGLGTVVQYVDEIEVEALPSDLPDKFEVDLNLLVEVDQLIQVKDLNVNKAKVEIQNEAEQIVVKVEPPREEKEEEVVVETPAEGEEAVEGEEPKPVEGAEVKSQDVSKEQS